MAKMLSLSFYEVWWRPSFSVLFKLLTISHAKPGTLCTILETFKRHPEDRAHWWEKCSDSFDWQYISMTANADVLRGQCRASGVIKGNFQYSYDFFHKCALRPEHWVHCSRLKTWDTLKVEQRSEKCSFVSMLTGVELQHSVFTGDGPEPGPGDSFLPKLRSVFLCLNLQWKDVLTM